jgi:hypothetical protein
MASLLEASAEVIYAHHRAGILVSSIEDGFHKLMLARLR